MKTTRSGEDEKTGRWRKKEEAGTGKRDARKNITRPNKYKTTHLTDNWSQEHLACKCEGSLWLYVEKNTSVADVRGSVLCVSVCTLKRRAEAFTCVQADGNPHSHNPSR